MIRFADGGGEMSVIIKIILAYLAKRRLSVGSFLIQDHYIYFVNIIHIIYNYIVNIIHIVFNTSFKRYFNYGGEY